MNFLDERKPAAYEDTLRLLAQAPEPDGLTERIQSRLQARLQAAPRPGLWRRILLTFARPQKTLLHAMAALVVLVVALGWILVRHNAAHAPSNAAAPQEAPAATQGLSTAGAVRKPQTVQGPVAPTSPNASPTTSIEGQR